MNFKKWMIACMAVLVAGTLFFVADTGHAEAEHDHADEVGLGHDEHGHAHVDGEAEPAVAAEQAHADEADDVHDDALRLTLEQRVRFGIVVTNAAPGTLKNEIRLTGVVSFDEDRLAHLTPRVSGVATAIRKTVGD